MSLPFNSFHPIKEQFQKTPPNLKTSLIIGRKNIGTPKRQIFKILLNGTFLR